MSETATNLILTLENTPSTNDKEALIRNAFLNGERDFFHAARIALDATVTFGIKKVTLLDEDGDGELSFGDFMKFAERLRNRELTGNAAISSMHLAADRSDSRIWNGFYRRILLKNFKAGFGSTIINKVLRAIDTPESLEYVIPEFTCQLAKSGTDHPKKMTGQKFLDVKLNGARLLTLVDIERKVVSQFSRNGNPIGNYPHLIEQFERLIRHLPFSVVFDGEVTARTFQELMGQLNRKSDVDTGHHKLQLFDVVPLEDFKNGKCAITQRARHKTLCDLMPIFQQENMESIVVLPKIEVNLSTPEGKASMEAFKQEVLEAARLAADENIIEGFMIKDPDAPYECRKGTNWLKWKPTLSSDLTIVGFEEGTPESKYVGMLGAIICEGTEDGKFIRVRVGSGFSDEDRQVWWNEQDRLLGQIVEIEHDEVTKAENSDSYSLRFPRYYRLRSFSLHAGEKD